MLEQDCIDLLMFVRLTVEVQLKVIKVNMGTAVMVGSHVRQQTNRRVNEMNVTVYTRVISV